MLLYLRNTIVALCFILLAFFNGSYAQLTDSNQVEKQNYEQRLKKVTDSLWSNLTVQTPFFDDAQRKAVILPQKEKSYHNDAGIFYMLLGLILVLGLIKYLGGNFFKYLFGVFTNTTNPYRKLKEAISQNKTMNLLMNIFACVVMGVYFYFVIISFGKSDMIINNYPKGILIITIILILMLLFGLRYLFLKTMGNIFHMQDVSDEYIFNLFLVNKILSILLIPFILLMAFGSAMMIKFASIISFLVIFLAYLNRYARSQGTYSQIVKLNKFHFFLYLCASEILPIAVLGKFVINQIY